MEPWIKGSIWRKLAGTDGIEGGICMELNRQGLSLIEYLYDNGGQIQMSQICKYLSLSKRSLLYQVDKMNDFAVYLFYLFVFSPTYKVVEKRNPLLTR